MRKESINLRRDILNQNIIFIDKIGEKQIGSLIIIDPFSLVTFKYML